MQNSENLVIFFHGFESSCDTDKFTAINNHAEKICVPIDYAKDFDNAKAIFSKVIEENLPKYDYVVLAGHSLGGYFANLLSKKYGLNALLIAPCLRPSHYLGDKIPQIADKNLEAKPSDQVVYVMVEKDDEELNWQDAETLLTGKNYKIQYYEGGHHKICRAGDINMKLDFALDVPYRLN